jgi:hypothetical protein
MKVGDFLFYTGLVSFVAALFYWAIFSDGAKERAAERAAQERSDATPHVIREADGCKVYAFKSGDWHYFTRCTDGSVTTERNWSERNGKQTVHKSETIVTENNR